MKLGSSLCLPLLATAMSKRAERALSAVNQRLASLAQLESELKSVEFRYGQEQLLRRADETAAIEEIVRHAGICRDLLAARLLSLPPVSTSCC